MLEIIYRDLRELRPYARNARLHSKSQVAKIKASLREFGWCAPVAHAEGELVAGHGRLMAALELAEAGIAIPHQDSPWDCPTTDLAHLSEVQRRLYAIADNQLSDLSTFDDSILSLELAALQGAGADLSVTGFEAAELSDLLAIERPGEDDKGSLLELVNITIAEPRHKVVAHDHYLLGGRHHLVCESVIDGWPRWRKLLKKGMLFVPYPGPMVPYGPKATESALVMVQPDAYIAGHILDRYQDTMGEGTVEHRGHLAA